MADESTKKISIPAWQQPETAASTPSASGPPSQTSDDNTTVTTPPSRSALVEQASKFLEDETIRDESTGRKVAFLESKGLRKDEIEDLLGVSRNDQASSVDDTESKSEASAATNNSAESVSSDDALQAPSTPASTTPSPPSTLVSTTTTTTNATSQPRDVPPIITYPEFLTKQSKPPPLVTFDSILYTLYGAAGLGASIYGASEYLVKPMLANLTTARHDFAEATRGNLHKLNKKLEQNVSTIPPQLTSRQSLEKEDDNDGEDADSITSDPTELFHRDVATQTTTQDLTPPKDKSADDVATPTATVNNHLSRLGSITSHLRDFSETEKHPSSADETMRSSLRDLHYYLDSLIYSNPSYSTGYGAWGSAGMSDSASSKATGIDKKEEEAIAGFRSEIRGVKGALLSARNFPSGRGGRFGGR